MRAVVALLLLFGVGCGESSLRAAGESCVASSQCQPGLVCNFGVDPHVCAGMGVAPPDGPIEEVDAPDVPDGGDVPDGDVGTPDSPPGTPDARPPDARRFDAPVDAVPDA